MRIAVLIGGIAYEVQKRLLEGVMKYAEEQKITIYVFTCNGDMYRQSEYGAGEFQIYSLPELARYDGVIFAKDTIQSEQCADEITEKIRKAGVPAVSIENAISGMSVFSIDNRDAMRELVTHFIEVHGVKDICYLSGPKQNPESSERLSGMLDAMKEHGLDMPSENIYYGNYWVDSGEAFVTFLAERGKTMPEAIICANDDMALGVYMELLKRGREPGKDILLSGFDHISDAAGLTPAITTVEKPQMQIGYEACKKLAEENIPENRKFRVKYCYRGSCGCKEYRKRGLAEVQLRNAKQRFAAVSLAENNKNMASDLNDCDNFEDFCDCLKNYISNLDFSFVYLALCEKKISEDKTEYDYRIREDYSERVYIPLAYEKGNFTKYPYFDRKELLPDVCREKLDGEVCIIAPLHFRKNCLGYLVMCGSRLPFNNTQFQNWIMNISSALENIRKQGELKRLLHKLNSVWMLDNLTQLYNRAGFFHYAGSILETCRIEELPIGMLFIDINKLKLVNDNYGHEEGDFYIKSVADSLKRLKKDKQLIMRYGGDEFVILGEIREKTEFADFMERLNTELEAYAERNGKKYEMSVSMGFQSVFISKEFKLDQLMEQADREMYKMKKKKGRAEK